MIYSRYGCQYEIIGYLGQQKPMRSKHQADLVRCRRLDDGKVLHTFTAYLKADKGISEIEDAMKAAPEIALAAAPLAACIREASL